MNTTHTTPNASNATCRDCGTSDDIPRHTVSDGSKYGTCRSCLHAPECKACGKHSIADGETTIQATIAGPLCQGCRVGLGMEPIKAHKPAPIKAPTSSKARKSAPKLVGVA